MKEKEKTTIKTYRDLLVWQKSMVLVTDIYRITQSFPSLEQYGLISQLRRSAISVPSNIAEGYGRNTRNDYMRFLQISLSSLYELQTQIDIALNLEYLNKTKYEITFESSREIERMLSSLISKLKN